MDNPSVDPKLLELKEKYFPGTEYFPGEEMFYKPEFHQNYVEVNIPGMPDTSNNEYIEFPDIGELMMMPQLVFADAEQIYKHGTYFQRMLLNKAPITNKFKHVYVTSNVRLLRPGVMANAITFGDRNEWHTDGIMGEHMVTHAIMNEVECRTEFNTTPIPGVKVPNNGMVGNDWFKVMSLKYGEKWGMKSQKVDSRKFISFSNHAHRASVPTRTELRFFFRIMETNNSDMGRDHIAAANSVVWTKQGDKNEVSLQYSPNGVFINYPINFMHLIKSNKGHTEGN